MYVKALLLSLAAVALAQDAPSSAPSNCPCSTLQTCLQQKKAAFEACKSQCQSQIPAAAQTCFTDKQTAFAALPKPQPNNCLFTPGNGLCVAGSRFARQVAQGQATGQPEDGEEHKHAGIPELKPYFECIRTCEKPNHPKPAGGVIGAHHEGGHRNGSHHGHRGGKFFEAFHRCANESSCTINRETAKQAFESCKPAAPQGAGDQFKQIEQTFCVCLRGALGKSETDMPCQPHARGGKPQA